MQRAYILLYSGFHLYTTVSIEMQLNPWVGIVFSCILAAIGALAGLGTQLTTLFGEHTADIIMSSTIIFLTMGNAVNAVLHAIPSKPDASFPLGPPKP